MTRVRVVRVMEYDYESVEEATADMAKWQVQTVRSFNPRCTIRSATLPMEAVPPPPSERDLAVQLVPETSSDERMHDLSGECWCRPEFTPGVLRHHERAPLGAAPHGT